MTDTPLPEFPELRPRSRVYYFAKHVGSRGAMLLILSALWARLFLYPLLIGRGTNTDVPLFYYEWPVWLRIVMWTLTITLGVVAAFVPPRKDWFGWTALAVMPAQRFFAWFWAAVELGASGQSALRAVDQLILYALIIGIVVCAASMRPPLPYSKLHPPPRHLRPVRDDTGDL